MDESKLQKYADIIYKENNRLHQLVDRVLQISDIEKNDQTLQLEKVDVHEVINQTIQSFEAMLFANNGHIKTLLKASSFTVNADRLHLSNVIYNLIENGIKYSDSNPEITIETREESNFLQISITDKGVGIKTEDKERIFEKFFRAESGDLHNTKGHGLGLSYVKLIIEKHNGKVSFQSKSGEGSTFTLKMPL